MILNINHKEELLRGLWVSMSCHYINQHSGSSKPYEA